MSRYDEMQAAFVERIADSGPAALETGTAVVIPSISFPATELRKIEGIPFYEERMLFMMMRLSDPAARLVYVTSMPIDEAILEHYLSFLSDPEGARARVELVCVNDPEARALSEKLLDDVGALEAIGAYVQGAEEAYIVPFNVSPFERDLAERLELPLYGPHIDLVPLGSKSGVREVAAAAGVELLPGEGNLFSIEQLTAAIDRLRAERDVGSFVIKLNNGFSGQGNAIISSAGLEDPLERSETVFCAAEETWLSYALKVADEGAAVEEHVRSAGIRSPSVQLRIPPGSPVEIVSTHEQILGGPDDQVYLGCRFPAGTDHRDAIVERATRVGDVLAERGVIGTFGMDFIVDLAGGVFLSEINLRMGGTTHPYLMTKLVTGGSYDVARGELIAEGRPVTYVASDNIKSPNYRGIEPRGLLDEMYKRGLVYDPVRGSGATFHLLGALQDVGKMGAVAIAGSHEEADELYAEVVAAVGELGARV